MDTPLKKSVKISKMKRAPISPTIHATATGATPAAGIPPHQQHQSFLSRTWSLFVKAEDTFIKRLGYKESYIWALRTIECLSLVILLIAGTQYLVDRSPSSDKAKAKPKVTLNFRLFQAQYLSVYLVVMLADWLQGTNMYTLYTSYNVDVGTLFLTGFLSSAVFGTFLGVYVDKWGRKLGCIIFCVLEIVINTLEHVPSMPVLLLGRVLGGLSTTLLFSAFESWMVTEHRRRGFHKDLLCSTFSIASWGSSVMAICAGLLAQISSDMFGDIGPFQLAIALTCAALVMIIMWWGENYGDEGREGAGKDSQAPRDDRKDTAEESILASIRSAMTTIWTSPAILYLGLSQAFFEGAMYTFVFLWVPSMQVVFKKSGHSSDDLPIGLVFSCFMLAMTIGGMLFGSILPIFPGRANGLCIFTYVLAAASMCVPVVKFDFWWVFGGFLVLEAMVGMFNSCGAQQRSEIYPGDKQSSIMSVFRLPLNLLVVAGTNAANHANDVPSMQLVFGLIVAFLFVASHLQVAMTAVDAALSRRSREDKKEAALRSMRERGGGGEKDKDEGKRGDKAEAGRGLDEMLDGAVGKKHREIILLLKTHVSELTMLENLAARKAKPAVAEK